MPFASAALGSLGQFKFSALSFEDRPASVNKYRVLTGRLAPPPVHPSRSSSSTFIGTSGFVSSETPASLSTKRQDSSPSALSSSGSNTTSVPTLGSQHELGQREWGDNLPEPIKEVALRRSYDDDEIQRFLHLFAAYVTEVASTGRNASRQPDAVDEAVTRVLKEEFDPVSLTEEDPLEDEEWVPTSPGTTDLPAFVDEGIQEPDSSSESMIAAFVRRYILPRLPPSKPPPPRFTVGRLRLATERLYLATEPIYFPLFTQLKGVCTWRDERKSLGYCSAFWFLWFYDLLLPAFAFRILVALLWSGMHPYPNLADLQRRRNDATKAAEVGEQLEARLIVSSGGPVTEFIRLGRLFLRHGKKRATGGDPKISDGSLYPDLEEVKEETDVKRAALAAVNSISDFHERVRNIYLWRRPATSRLYSIIVGMVCMSTLFVSVRVIVKICTLALGIAFWFFVPFLAAMDPKDRQRLMGEPFADAPTDAQYAIELIADRVARGEDIRPIAQKAKRGLHRTDSRTTGEYGVDTSSLIQEDATRPDWTKWAQRAERGIAVVEKGRKILGDSDSIVSFARSLAERPLQTDSAFTSKFPAQHTSGPGVVTVAEGYLTFVTLLSANRIMISFDSISGVRKTTSLQGLIVRWTNTTADGENHTAQEAFRWVGGRDELFARIVGWGGKNWNHIA